MKKILAILVGALLLLPVVFANEYGSEIDIDMDVEEMAPLVWLCDDRVISEDPLEGGRITNIDDEQDILKERHGNYLFTGEDLKWEILVMDKNKLDGMHVYVNVGDDMVVECVESSISEDEFSKCNAWIGEEKLDEFYSSVMQGYTCTLTVTSDQYGEYWIEAVAEDVDGNEGRADEPEYWYLNPTVALDVDGDIDFGTVRPGTNSYSDPVVVSLGGDAADAGIMMDMFISGTDFLGTDGALCSDSGTNKLLLWDENGADIDDTGFSYYATNGQYDTYGDAEDDTGGLITRAVDDEGYVNIDYGNFFDPNEFYEDKEIIQEQQLFGGYYIGNILQPGSDMVLVFKLKLPEPCTGSFTDGSLYIWGEAI